MQKIKGIHENTDSRVEQAALAESGPARCTDLYWYRSVAACRLPARLCRVIIGGAACLHSLDVCAEVRTKTSSSPFVRCRLHNCCQVHSRSEGATCGPVMPQGGVQALEALLFALDAAAAVAPPGVTIGAHVLDDCDNDTYGLEMALDFIKGSISNIDDAEFACNASAVRKVISGVVGAASSVTSVQVANLLRLFKIPQVQH
ncbi:unnamed protein product [Plutella xylostella]|uniref:(diamondback moth) hypothetical protein n=1 Tax=Plutella xylostella TaxID=51655 RepID=A0A8S4FFB9_PLUXY|nr:unnamed protein product [Plutella xylostella]